MNRGTWLWKFRNHRITRNASWVLLGQGTSFLVQAGYLILLARLLGSTEYGVFAGAYALVATLTPYSALGSAMLFMRYVSADPKRSREYWGNTLLSTACVTVLLLGIVYFATPIILGGRNIGTVLLLGSAYFFFNQIVSCAGVMFQTFERLRGTAMLNLLANAVRFLVVGTLFVLQSRASAFEWAVGAFISSLVACIIAVVWIFSVIGPPIFTPRLMLSHFWEGLNFSVAGSTQSVYNDIDKMLLSHFGMNAQSGFYTLAYRVIDFATAPINAIDAAALPRYFYLSRRGNRQLLKLWRKLLVLIVPIGFAILGTTLLLAPIVPSLVGKSYTGAISALRWLCLLPLLRGFHQISGSALTGSGRQQYRTITQFSAAGLNLGLNLWLIPAFGWIGAAWATLATDGALGVANTLLLLLTSRLRIRRTKESEVAFEISTIV